MTELSIGPVKDTSLRRVRANKNEPFGPWKQAKGEWHLIGGYSTGDHNEHFASFLQFDIPWADIASWSKAELWLYTSDDHTGLTTQDSKGVNNIRIIRKPANWVETGGAEGGWTGGIASDDMDTNDNYKAYGKVSHVVGAKSVININAIVRAVTPKTVKAFDGKVGVGLADNGMQLAVSGTTPDTYSREWVVGSKDHANSSLHPLLVLTYVPKGGVGLTFGESPVGNYPSSTDQFFTGRYEPGRSEDHLHRVRVQVLNRGGTTVVWDSNDQTGGSNAYETNTFSVPVPKSLAPATDYDWIARVTNQRGK